MPTQLIARPFHICMPAFRIVQARTGQIVGQTGPEQEILPLPGCTSLMDGEYIQRYQSPATYHAPKKRQSEISLMPHPQLVRNQPGRQKKSERHPCDSRKNQAEDGPNTRRAAVRACKYLRAMVNQYGSIIHKVHKAAHIHTQMSKGTAGSTADYRPQGGELPVISPELTSELLHCLSTLPDPCHG